MAKFSDLVIGTPVLKAFLRAAYISMMYPHARVSTWCHNPIRCPLPHKLVLVRPPNKPARFGLKHVKGA